MTQQHSRHIGPVALMLTGLGSIIGSGWLFGAAHAAQIAGPAAIVAWIVGMVIILSIALSYAELGAMFPESGGMVRYARYSHGSLLGFIAGWANWIAIVSVIPIEAEASVQYMSSWPYAWAQHLFSNGELTPPGLMLAALLVIVYFLLNYWGVRLFAKANSAITIFKVIVPALTVGALIYSGFHPGNLGGDTPGGFAPFGWASVMTAVATSGIVFSFNGFQSPINLAGEARNPGKSVPFGVVGSILLAAVIYVALQVAFIGALSPADLAHGWQGLNFSSPFAQLAMALGLNWLMLLLYFDAFVSPSGTGATYMASPKASSTGRNARKAALRYAALRVRTAAVRAGNGVCNPTAPSSGCRRVIALGRMVAQSLWRTISITAPMLLACAAIRGFRPRSRK